MTLNFALLVGHQSRISSCAVETQGRQRARCSGKQVYTDIGQPEMRGQTRSATSGANAAPISQARSDVSAAPV